MSETGTLISYTSKITRADLAHIPTPQSTATHVPIPHAAVVEALVETLNHRQISVVDQEYTSISRLTGQDRLHWTRSNRVLAKS